MRWALRSRPVTVAAALGVSFPALGGLEICRVEIPAGAEKTFVSVTDRGGQKSEALYVRMGNKAEEIPGGREITRLPAPLTVLEK